MRYACLPCFLLVSLVGQTEPSCGAQDKSPDQNQLIEKYIKDLGSSVYRVRERARVELERIGPPAQEAVRKATESADPQVRWTAQELFANLGTVLLPAPLEDVAVADSGRILVLKLRDQKGLTVYDTQIRKLRTIELPTADFTFGAGGNVVVVFLKESFELRSYNLTTLEKIQAKDFVDPVVVQKITMGHSRENLAFLRVFSEGNSWNFLLNVTTLKLQRPKERQPYQDHSNSNYQAYYRANGDMSRLSEWTNERPGTYLYTRSEQGYQLHKGDSGFGHLAMGDDGKMYTGYGHIVDLNRDLLDDAWPIS
jgi:hypothetical protein